MIFNEDHIGYAATDGFDADCAGACKEVEKASAFDVPAKNVEERFAEHVAGGPNAKVLERLQPTRAKCSGDDAHGQPILVSQCGPGDSGAAMWRAARVEFASTRLSVQRPRPTKMLPCARVRGTPRRAK